MSRMRIVKSMLIAAAACLLVTSATVVSAPGQASSLEVFQQQIEQALQPGDDYLEQGSYEQAIDAYTQVIQAYDPNPPADAYLGRAKAFDALKEYDSALRDYSAALEVDERLPEAYNGRGEIRLRFSGTRASTLTEALGDFYKAVENDRTNPTYSVNLAKALIRFGVGGASQALQAVNRALKVDTDNAEAYRTRAQAYALLQDFEKAATDISKAAEIEPDNHENHYVMGLIHMQSKEHQKAVEAFYLALNTYVDADPENPTPYVDPYLASSLAYIELGKESNNLQVKQVAYAKAIEETENALKEQPLLPLAWLNRGVALRLLELYADARDSFTQAIQMSPDFSEAYFRRGIVWYYMQQPELARKDFREAIAINFDDVRPYLWTGVTLADEGRYYDAIMQYGQAINLDPRFVPAYVNRGLAYAQLGEFEKAEDNFNEAIRLEPNEATHHFKRGSVLMALERYDEALRSYSNAMSNAPYYVDAYRKAAEALDMLGNAELAVKYREEADKIEAAIQEKLQELREQAEQQQIGSLEDLPSAEDVLRAGAEKDATDSGLEAVIDVPDVPSVVPNPSAENPFENFVPPLNEDPTTPLDDIDP